MRELGFLIGVILVSSCATPKSLGQEQDKTVETKRLSEAFTRALVVDKSGNPKSIMDLVAVPFFWPGDDRGREQIIKDVDNLKGRFELFLSRNREVAAGAEVKILNMQTYEQVLEGLRKAPERKQPGFEKTKKLLDRVMKKSDQIVAMAVIAGEERQNVSVMIARRGSVAKVVGFFAGARRSYDKGKRSREKCALATSSSMRVGGYDCLYVALAERVHREAIR